MAPYVSVTVDKMGGSEYVKLYLPLDMLAAYDAKDARWVWDSEKDEVVDLATGATFHERVGSDVRVNVSKDVWDYRISGLGAL